MLMFLKAKLAVHQFWLLLFCTYPLGQSENAAFLLFVVASKSVPQSDVFLLPEQSVGALASLTKTVFCSRVKRFLIKILSFFVPSFLISLFFLYFSAFFVIGFPAVVITLRNLLN
jgi:hypothetical protein